MKRQLFVRLSSFVFLAACATPSAQVSHSTDSLASNVSVLPLGTAEDVIVIGKPSGKAETRQDGSRSFSGPVSFKAKGFSVSGNLRSLTLLPNGKVEVTSAGNMKVAFRPGTFVSHVTVVELTR